MDKNIRNETKKLRRTLKSGAYTAAICAVLAVILVFVNLITTVLPTSVMKIDLTANGLYSVGDTTKQVLSGINSKIDIYHVYESANEDPSLSNFLERYTELNSNIKVSHIDPGVDPAAIRAYTDEEVYDNSLIVVGPKRTTVVHIYDMYQYYVQMLGAYLSADEYNMYNYQYQMSSGSILPYEEFFFAEQEITSALDYVTADVITVMYYTSKHGEEAIGSSYLKDISHENIDLKELNMSTVTAVPADAEAVIINAPMMDFTEDETAMLKTYMENGGSVVLLTNFQSDVNKNLPNIAKLCGDLGLTSADGLLEERTQNRYMGGTHNTLPAFNDASAPAQIMKTANVNIIMGLAHGILINENTPYVTTPILTSSDKAVLVNLKNKEGTTGTDSVPDVTGTDVTDTELSDETDTDITESETTLPETTNGVAVANENETENNTEITAPETGTVEGTESQFDEEVGQFYTGVHVSLTSADATSIVTDPGNFYWYSSNFLMTNDNSYVPGISASTGELFISTLNAISGKQTSISIIGKALDAGYLTFSNPVVSLMWQIVLMIVLPVGTVIAGVAVWYKRRRK